jgi:hypothetical protein
MIFTWTSEGGSHETIVDYPITRLPNYPFYSTR